MRDPNHRIFTPKRLVIALVALIIAAAAAYGTYVWQHHKVNNLDDKVSTLNAKVNNLNGQLSVLGAQLNKACPQNQSSTTSPACSGFTYQSDKGVSVRVFTPVKNETVSSPVAVVGEVPGSWSFEAQFPVQLKDSKGNVIAQASAKLLGNWQTSNLVPFSVQLTYTSAESGSGSLVLVKDNPSGLAQNADSVTIPLKF